MLTWLRSILRFFKFGPTVDSDLVPRADRGSAAPRPVRRYYPTVPLARHDGPDRPPPLTWKTAHPSTIARFKAEVTCSQGHGIVLRDHTVEADGRVVPSIVCNAPGCDFHEIVRLEDWTAGRLPGRLTKEARTG